MIFCRKLFNRDRHQLILIPRLLSLEIFSLYSLFQVYEVHQGDLWGRAGSLIPRLRSAQGLFVCGKFNGEPAPTEIHQKIDQD